MKHLAIFLGLLFGLCLAVLAFGKVSHLRLLAQDRLPAWSANLDGSSGLLEGRAAVPLRHLPQGSYAASWSFSGLRNGSPVWAVALRGEGVRLNGKMALTAPFEGARLQEGTGTITLAALSPSLPIDLPDGILLIDQFDAGYRAADQRVTDVRSTGRIEDASMADAPLGNGTFQLRSDVGGGWWLSFQIAGPLARIDGEMSGLIGRNRVTLDAILSPVGTLPVAWTRALPSLGQLQQDGSWQIELTVP
ncbi:hypothetical protein KUV28_18395 [Ferrimonas balearica]|nr:hypothetical protein [Ferrimonas balearica]